MTETCVPLSPIIGLLVWSVKRGHGSFLTMEFGNPNLEVREPVVSSLSAMPKVTEALARRHVSIKGTWHFWVQDAVWGVSVGSKKCRYDSDNKVVDDVLKNLDGQRLIAINVADGTRELVLDFDLGGVLDISPLPEQLSSGLDVWSLHQWEGDIISSSQKGVISIEKRTMAASP